MESLRGRVRKWWLRLYNRNCSPVFFILFSAPAFFYLTFLKSSLLFLSITPHGVNVSWLESPSMCKLLGLSFLIFGGRLGSLAFIRRDYTFWALFSLSPFALEGFFGL